MNITNILLTVAEIGQLPNDKPATFWLVAGIIIGALALVLLVFSYDGLGWFIFLGIVSAFILVPYFVVSNGTHMMPVTKTIEEAYDIEIMNKDKIEQEIFEIEEFEPIKLSYKSNGAVYVETIYFMKSNIVESNSMGKGTIISEMDIELFSAVNSDKVKTVPFEACSIDTCPDGIRKFN